MADANPFVNPYAQQPPAQDPYGNPGINPYGAPPNNMPPQQNPGYGYQQESPYQQQGYNQAPGVQYNNALVPSQQQSNPYAGVVPPQGQQQNNPWQQQQQAPGPGQFDPFSAPPPAPPTQALVPVAPAEGGNPYPGAPPYQQHQYQQPPQQYGHQQQLPPPMPPQQPPAPAPPAPAPSHPVNEVAIVPAPSSGYPGAPSTPRQTAEDRESMTPRGAEARNKYSTTLAQNAPLGASPLPRADMVRKTGYVLSRISFRTIVMKKWKQSFWVQYGPHTMLWFRSQADFDDWLNNPYHTQAQRNFLIKLAVNFAHDLYKPNVRGYQVTQCRTKSYGTKLIRQFKLERWMDYGPTIAAAFGSNNPKEVDDLREALVACMRNTPLNGGIRATGAVRERNEGQSEGGGMLEGGYESNSYAGHANPRQSANRSVASANDIMDDQKAFDDNRPAEAPDLLDFSEPPQQQPPMGMGQPPQQYGAPQGYPMQQGQYPPQQQYGAPPPQQYGAPPQGYPMQQQYPPQGQPQPYGGY